MKSLENAADQINRDIAFAEEHVAWNDDDVYPSDHDIRAFIEYCLAALHSVPVNSLKESVTAAFVPPFGGDLDLGAWLLLESGSIWVMYMSSSATWTPVWRKGHLKGSTAPFGRYTLPSSAHCLAHIMKNSLQWTDEFLDEMKDARNWEERAHVFLYVGGVPHPSEEK